MKILIYIVITVIVGFGGFYIGLKYGKLTADSGTTQNYILNEDMAILNDELKNIGILPKGMVLYSIPDPWGDKSMFYKIYFRVDTNDCSPIHRLEPRPKLKKFQNIEFYLKSKEWMNKQ